MRLLGTEAFRNALAEGLQEARNEVAAVSAFVTRTGFEWLLRRNPTITGKLVVRWRLADILSGVSDLSVYKDARENGWAVFVSPDLHAKSILIDKSVVYVGSANITGSGFSVGPRANQELGVFFSASEQDIAVFENFIAESILVTDEIYEKLSLFIVSQCDKKDQYIKNNITWPEEIAILFQKPPQRLWVADLLWTKPLETTIAFAEDDECNIDHDSRILGINGGIEQATQESLCNAFLVSRAWRWLKRLIDESGEEGLLFGAITASLHNALLDDPTPYRKDVKGLVQNLYAWVKFLKLPGVEIDQPGRRSERIRVTARF